MLSRAKAGRRRARECFQIAPSLEKMEEEMFLQIITGAVPVDAFDTFAEQWYASGGAALLEKLNGL